MSDLEREVALIKQGMETIHEGLATIRELPLKVAEMTGAIERCGQDTAYLRTQIDERNKAREEERKQARRDKRSDRRWMVGTALTSASLIIGAIALFADKF